MRVRLVYLLMVRLSAWKVMVQQLGEMAEACARLGPEVGLDQVATLEATVQAIAAGLRAHLDQRP